MSNMTLASCVMEPDAVLDAIKDKSLCVIDARRTQDYIQGHLHGAISFPLWDLLKDDSPETVAKLAGDAGIDGIQHAVVYDDSFGAVASRVAWTLEHAGHKSISLLSKTFADWKKLGLPIEQSEVQANDNNNNNNSSSVKFASDPNYDIGANLNDVKDADGAILLDNRERLNFLENHIPGAVNLPYRTLADPDNNSILRSPKELKRLFENRNITAEKNIQIITYCGSAGTLSGLAYYALKSAGITNVKMYSKSFKDWTEHEMPTDTQPDANYWDLSAE